MWTLLPYTRQNITEYTNIYARRFTLLSIPSYLVSSLLPGGSFLDPPFWSPFCTVRGSLWRGSVQLEAPIPNAHPPPTHTTGRDRPPPVLRSRRMARSVCRWQFAHVMYIVNEFIQVKYNNFYDIHILLTINKSYFRIYTYFHILVLMRTDPTYFGGGGWE